MFIFTECPHCKEEIQLVRLEETGIKKTGDVLIGDSGQAICPSCKKVFDYEIRILTTDILLTEG